MSAATSTTVTLSYFWNISRMCLTMTPSWTSMLTQPTGSPWRDTSTRGPATPSRPGAGTSLPTTCLAQNSCIVVFFFFLRLFSHLTSRKERLKRPLCWEIVSTVCAVTFPSLSFLSLLIDGWFCDPFHVLPPLQALVFDSEKSAGVSEEIQGIFWNNCSYPLRRFDWPGVEQRPACKC